MHKQCKCGSILNWGGKKDLLPLCVRWPLSGHLHGEVNFKVVEGNCWQAGCLTFNRNFSRQSMVQFSPASLCHIYFLLSVLKSYCQSRIHTCMNCVLSLGRKAHPKPINQHLGPSRNSKRNREKHLFSYSFIYFPIFCFIIQHLFSLESFTDLFYSTLMTP